MLSWNEIRTRAAQFSREWADAHYEKGETQSFYNDFFDVFGIKRRKVASFEAPVKTLGDKRGYMDLFWKGMLLVEHKSAGRSLIRAKQQALDYFPGLKDAELPRYLLLSDFQHFELYDLDEDTEVRFALSELEHNVEHFGFVIGLQKRTFREQDPVNIHAAETLGRLHDALKASGYGGEHLQWLLVRLVFCLFADDTGIFSERGSFRDWIERESREDGANLGRVLNELFDILDTPAEKRQIHLDETLNGFPYINGELFSRPLRMPAFNRAMRDTLLEASAFDWSKISPAIFGSLFQSVMDAPERRQSGAHYTSEGNILKLIQPLFMDELYAEFAKIQAQKQKAPRERALQAFLHKLATITVFDPACGCGNFLIIAYRELRLLEMQVLRALYPVLQLKITEFNRLINVDQFYGIELGEFPARIAEVALWMMDHIMNVELGRTFGEDFIRIPLKTSPHIICGDALELDWQQILPADQCSYVLGNPPFVGAKYQTPAQREQVRKIAQLPGSGGTLDYVAAWFLKAGEYVNIHSPFPQPKPTIAFVATNSISQGEQVAQLWPLLFDRYQLDIQFAHRTFAWGSDARGMAHVHVVIVGLAHRCQTVPLKRLFNYETPKSGPVESRHQALTAYLFPGDGLDNPQMVVREAPRSLMGYPPLMIGSKPIDDGQYIFSTEEKEAFLQAEPGAESFMRPFMGAQEFINGTTRWILALHNASPQQLNQLPDVKQRMQAVQTFRQNSKSKPTQQLAQTPTLYHVNVIPERPFLVIPPRQFRTP